MSTHWSFNCSKNSNPVWISDYDKWATWFQTKFKPETFEMHYEKGIHNKLHVHGFATFKKPKKFTQYLFRKKGWKVLVVPTYDVEGWLRYIRKDIEHETTLINEENGLEKEYDLYQDTISNTFNHSSDEPEEAAFSAKLKSVNLFEIALKQKTR